MSKFIQLKFEDKIQFINIADISQIQYTVDNEILLVRFKNHPEIYSKHTEFNKEFIRMFLDLNDIKMMNTQVTWKEIYG